MLNIIITHLRISGAISMCLCAMCRILKTITQYLTINKQLTMKTTSLDIPLKWPTNTIHMYPHRHTCTQTQT